MKFPQLNIDDFKRFEEQPLAGGVSEPLKSKKTIFGLEKTFFTDLFIPKENTFQNSIFDLTVENNRFLSFPFFFNEDSIKAKGRKSKI